MKQYLLIPAAAILVACAGTGSTSLAQESVLRAELQALEFLIGNCWRGEFPDGKRVDTHCFESIYDGQHVRDEHVVTGGRVIYRGETVYSWNVEARTIGYVYWNSLGGVSTGTANPGGEQIRFPDETYRGADGESVTISTRWENISADGYDSVVEEVFQNGQRSERRVRYEKT